MREVIVAIRSAAVGDRVAVRVDGRVAERRVDPRLELLREDVLEPVGLGVHLVERHAERVREVALEQAMVAQHLERAQPALVGQHDAAVRRPLDEAELGEPLHHRRRRRGADLHPLGESRGRRALALRTERVDRLEVVLDRARELLARIRHGQRSGYTVTWV